MRQRGFIALASAIIISVLLLAITAAISLTGFFGRFNVFDSESKERSSALAEACIDTAKLNYANNSSYAPNNQSVSVGSDQCTIISFLKNTPTTGQDTIKTQASINKSYTDLQVVIKDTDFSLISWDELPHF